MMKQVTTKEIEQAMNTLKQTDTEENRARLTGLMERFRFFVPALLPPDTDPALIRQIIHGNGRVPLPAGVSPRPAVLQNNRGEQFLPLFTSQEQVARGKQQAPLTLCIPFQDCVNLVAGQEKVHGVVLNPFDQGITLNIEKNQRKEVSLTEPQLHAAIRQQVEASALPSALFEKKEELLRQIREREGEVLLEFYRERYPDDLPCPYTAEEFEVMSLNIREDLSILRITMPTEKLTAGTCPMVLISCDPQQGNIRYFGIVRGQDGQKAHIMEALEDGSKQDLGEAPSEGSELQFIIDVNGK